MPEDPAGDCSQAGRLPLNGVFEQVLQHVAAEPIGEMARVLIAFAAALLNGDEFNLAQIETLSEPEQALCMALLDHCMSIGLTEDERREASAAFAPFAAIYAPGLRH
jgi:hypothetical protein